jgi:hypothetical protein
MRCFCQFFTSTLSAKRASITKFIYTYNSIWQRYFASCFNFSSLTQCPQKSFLRWLNIVWNHFHVGSVKGELFQKITRKPKSEAIKRHNFDKTNRTPSNGNKVARNKNLILAKSTIHSKTSKYLALEPLKTWLKRKEHQEYGSHKNKNKVLVKSTTHSKTSKCLALEPLKAWFNIQNMVKNF